MLGLHWADWLVLVVYFVGVTWLGVWASKLVKNMQDFFMPRKFGKIMLTTHAFGTGTHSDQAVGVAAKTFTNGLSGIWYQWLWLFCTPFYWLIAPMMRRFRAITTADVFTARYGRSVGMLFALVGTVQLSFNMGVMLKGSGAVITVCFGNTVSPDVIILLMTVLFVAYGMAGGLAAAIITDFVQGLLTVVFSVALLPPVLMAVGGMTGMRHTIADASMFSLVAPNDIGVFYIAVLSLNALVGVVTQPHTMGNCAAGRTELDGRIGWTVGNFIKRLCTMAWCITGLAALAYLGKDANPDEIYGTMARTFLPTIMPGLLGVFLASLLASVMSSCDSFMIASSALFTENIYKTLLPNRSGKHYLWVGRMTALAVVFGGLCFAYFLDSVVQGLEIFWKISPMLGIAFWLGLFWRRATTAGAWSSTLAAFATWWLTTQSWVITWMKMYMPILIVQRSSQDEMSLPWQMLCYLVIGTLVGIAISLISKPTDHEQLERFYALVRTPIGRDEPQCGQPCVIPEGIEIPPRRLLFRIPGLEITKPDRTSIIGFLLCCLGVIVLIAVFALWVGKHN